MEVLGSSGGKGDGMVTKILKLQLSSLVTEHSYDKHCANESPHLCRGRHEMWKQCYGVLFQEFTRDMNKTGERFQRGKDFQIKQENRSFGEKNGGCIVA